jgi:hypothetical protein
MPTASKHFYFQSDRQRWVPNLSVNWSEAEKKSRRPDGIEIPVPSAFKMSKVGIEVERALQKDYRSLGDDQFQGSKTGQGWKIANYNNRADCDTGSGADQGDPWEPKDAVGMFEKKLTKDYVYTQSRKAAGRKVLSVVDASHGVYR